METTTPATVDHGDPDGTVTVGGYLATRLRQLGVEHLFGLPGDFNLALLDEMLADHGISWVGSGNELNAAYAADGYARVRGFGALVTTYGVGELSAINGVAGAYAESVPLVQITGAPPTAAAAAGTLTHHTLVDGDFGHFARSYTEVSAAAETLAAPTAAQQIDRTLAEALRTARPVYLSVPSDVAVARVPSAPLTRPLVRAASDRAALAAFTAALRAAFPGVGELTVLAGHLVRRRGLGPLVRRLADGGSAHVATLLGAKGLLDEEHPAALGTYIGMYTADEATRKAVEAPDRPLLLAGAVLSDLATGMFSHDLDLGRSVVLDLRTARVAGQDFAEVDLADSLAAVVELFTSGLPGTGESAPDAAPVHASASRPLPAGNRAAEPVVAKDAADPLTQTELWEALQEWIAPGTTVIADAGTAYYGAAGLSLPADSELLGQPIWSSIGYTLPALLGVQLADTSRRPLLLVGDGAAQLTAQELGTLFHLRLAPVIVVLNNGGYTVERAIRSPDAVYQDVVPWDWTALTAALGGTQDRALALTVTTGEEFRRALHTAGTEPGRAVLIEARLHRDDIPALLASVARGLNRAHESAA